MRDAAAAGGLLEGHHEEREEEEEEKKRRTDSRSNKETRRILTGLSCSVARPAEGTGFITQDFALPLLVVCAPAFLLAAKPSKAQQSPAEEQLASSTILQRSPDPANRYEVRFLHGTPTWYSLTL